MKSIYDLDLTPEEIDFVECVFNNSGCKYPRAAGSFSTYDEETKTGGDPLWKKPEQLGIIECIGSYKWRPKNIKQLLCVKEKG